MTMIGDRGKGYGYYILLTCRAATGVSTPLDREDGTHCRHRGTHEDSHRRHHLYFWGASNKCTKLKNKCYEVQMDKDGIPLSTAELEA